MLFVLSPAKDLDFTHAPSDLMRTVPRLGTDAAGLARVARRLKLADIARLMDLSDRLSDLNWHRFQALDAKAMAAGVPADSDLQAALAFDGDVYKGLRARDLDPAALDWAQDRVRILSGLYGLLRPLDAIAPYRLEMGTRLPTRRGASLYDYWGPRIARLLKADLSDHAHPLVVNLASQEYFGAVDIKALKAPVVTCHFREEKDGETRVISFFAKHARGAMARFAIDNRIEDPADLRAFTTGGYAFDQAASGAHDLVFVRPQPAPVGKGAPSTMPALETA
jgi:uncharacterized protein